MPIAVAAALAALLTLLAFLAPDLFGSALALTVVATVCRLGTLLLLRRAAALENPGQEGGGNAAVLDGLRLLFLGEALFAAATVAGLPVEPHIGDTGSDWAAGWAGLAAWLAMARPAPGAA